MSDQISFNTIYTVICLIFSCGTAYATIKVSIKSIVTDMENMKRRMDAYEAETKRRLELYETETKKRLEAHEIEMQAWRTEREVSRVRYEQLTEKMGELSGTVKEVKDTLHKLEKRGNLQWRENVQSST